jgi:choline-glycine betaine transporter
MRRGIGSTIDPGVFWISLVISILFVLWGVLFTDNLAAVASAVLDWLIASFGWVFILASFGFLAFVIFLALSRYGRIKLGNDDEPEFSTTSWVAMMFSAGMGIGLMFYGVAEPISHLTAPPHGLAKAGTAGAIISAAPFVLVMIGLCWSIFKELRSETLPGVAPEPERAATRPRGTAAPQQTSSLDPGSGG